MTEGARSVDSWLFFHSFVQCEWGPIDLTVEGRSCSPGDHLLPAAQEWVRYLLRQSENLVTEDYKLGDNVRIISGVLVI